MSIEKIAAIKAKRLALKRTMIKEDDDLGLGTDLQSMLEFDIDVTKDITTKERQWRTRTTILQSSGKVSQVAVFDICIRYLIDTIFFLFNVWSSCIYNYITLQHLPI